MTHRTYFQRPGPDETETEIEVEFTLTGGHGGSGPSWNDPGEPPEAPELDFVQAIEVETGLVVTLTDDEAEKVQREIYDRLPDFEDDGDYDDYRERDA